MKKIIFIIILFLTLSGCYVVDSPYPRRYLNVEVVYPNNRPYYYSYPKRPHYHNHNNQNHHYNGPRRK